MSNIRPIDMSLIDDLFEMRGGYVLDFTDRTFREFFIHELQLDIDHPKFAANGQSKGKRLRYFLQTVDKPTAAKTLSALWEYREATRRRAGRGETIPNAEEEIWQIIERLGGAKPTPRRKQTPDASVDKQRLLQLSREFIDLTKLDAQPRGYAFERFLKALFDANGMDARDAFRLKGEQIDGSFQIRNDTYLLEARWRNAPADAADLRAFHGKVEEKAAWSRGLFISQSGFSEDGLYAFGRGKRLICMDGLDLFETLNRGLALDEVLARKVRRAAETGSPFARVRDLF